MKVSVIIPSCNEFFLYPTVTDVFDMAVGEIEVIVVLDGTTGFPLPPERKNLTYIRKPVAEGARTAINDAVSLATGEYILKLDAHCAVAYGFDEVLKSECDYDWVVVPRLYTLDYYAWKPVPFTSVDYYYLSCPWNHHRFFQMQSCFWNTHTNDALLDEIMAFQGSCWFMHTRYWREHLKGISPTFFGTCGEHQEISLKTWLGGGKVMVNKKTWYAHDHRNHLRRGYDRGTSRFVDSHIRVARYFARNEWKERVHDFAWLVERFWPLPTQPTPERGEVYYWPENWRDFVSGAAKGMVE